MNAKIITIVIMLLAAPFCYGAPADDAAKAYEKGDYATAISIYEQMSARHGVSSELLYDMGQAYTKAGRYGNAMLCYQRALKINPYNSKARSNICYVESKVQDANRAELKGKKISVAEETPSFFMSLKNYITHRNSSNAWAFWAAACFVLFTVCVALYIFTPQVVLRKIGFFGGATTLALTAIFLVFAFMAASESTRQDTGVITAFKAELRHDPTKSSKAATAPLTQGTVMNVLETADNKNGKAEWYKVRLNSDYIGWIRSEDFELI